MITSMGDDDSHQSFVNPNLVIRSLEDDVLKDKSSTCDPLQGTTMMGFCDDDSAPIRFNRQIRIGQIQSSSVDSQLQTSQHPDTNDNSNIDDHDVDDDDELPANG